MKIPGFWGPLFFVSNNKKQVVDTFFQEKSWVLRGAPGDKFKIEFFQQELSWGGRSWWSSGAWSTYTPPTLIFLKAGYETHYFRGGGG